MMGDYSITHLRELEAEAIYVIREVGAQFEKPTLLFSGGKDSIVMYHLARKAFWPQIVPFPCMHIDTGHNFHETLEFRDQLMESTGGRVIVRLVQDSIDSGKVVEETGVNASRNVLQTVTLLDAIEEFKFDAALGGGEGTKRKPAPKNAFFRTGMISDNGIRKTSVRSFGTYSMAKSTWESTFAYSR